MSHDNSVATATPSTTRWWWKKSPSTASTKTKEPSIKSSIVSSINGADEDASTFSLYSYGESICSPPSARNTPSSIRAQHTKSEYSGQLSDVESTASILSKPWVSRNVISPEGDHASKHDEEEKPDYEEENSLVSESFSNSTPQVNHTTSSTDILDTSVVPFARKSVSSPQSSAKRRGSFVDYITRKPLHGKLKAGFGRLVGSNKSYSNSQQQQQQQEQQQEILSSSIRRRSFG